MPIFQGTLQEWNELLVKCSEYSFYQSYEWGQVKKEEGWDVRRYIEKGERQFAIAQVLMKRIPVFGGFFLWIPGGPLFSGSTNILTLERIVKNVENHHSGEKYVIRYNQQISRTPVIVNMWRKMGYLDPIFRISSTLNVIIDSKYIKSLEKDSHSKFRYSIRKAKKNPGLNVSSGGDALLPNVLDLYSQMITRKKLRHYRSRGFLEKIIFGMKDKVIIFVVKLGNKPVSCAILIYIGNRAFYFLGASNGIGRKSLSSYLLFDCIHQWCLRNNIRYFDLCGSDPLIDYGTYEFKVRTGGEIVEYVGEREKASSSFVRVLFNLSLCLKGMQG